MIQDITGQPQAGLIGGMRDLLVDIGVVNDKTSKAQNESAGFQTSPEQGADYDAGEVSLLETLSPDRLLEALNKTIPWWLLAFGGLAVFFILKRK